MRALRPLLSGLLLALMACGPAQPSPEALELASRTGALMDEGERLSTNGIALNGIALNGIALNGIALNGIALNGIALNGLTPEAASTEQFAEWFQTDPDANEVLMSYVVRCGLEPRKRITFQDPGTGEVYAWEGLLGLTPGWAKGAPVSEAEQQLLTACLAAHANKYGVHIAISVLGDDAKGSKVHYTHEELATFSRPEACFFGNTFGDEGIFVGSDRDFLDSTESTARACGLTSAMEDTSNECPPFIHIGSCSNVCELDKSGLYYTRCTINGKTYRPITTRLKPADVYYCGDGVCQFTESCGTGTSWDNCQSDCGTCTTM